MPPSSKPDPSEPWNTLTHARLRAAQGDVGGAWRILQAVLARDPLDGAALHLLQSLGEGRVPAAEPHEERLEQPVPGDARLLARRFQEVLFEPGTRRRPGTGEALVRWLDTLRRNARAHE